MFARPFSSGGNRVFFLFLLIPTVAFFVSNHDHRERGIQLKQDSAARRSRILQVPGVTSKRLRMVFDSNHLPDQRHYNVHEMAKGIELMYRKLDPQKTISTLDTLAKRIEERFPGASLNGVCKELSAIAVETCGRITWVSRPYKAIRFALLLVIAAAGCLGWLLFGRAEIVEFKSNRFSIEELEAVTNGIVLTGAALFFLFSLESRMKRARILHGIDELRAVSHVIDMHQLTKDPSQLLSVKGKRTKSSPERTLTPFQLARYLDYCSELLSLIGKLAALYAQSTSDSVVLQAVNDIETLTNGISRKIWQKIMILDDDIAEEVARENQTADMPPTANSSGLPELLCRPGSLESQT